MIRRVALIGSFLSLIFWSATSLQAEPQRTIGLILGLSGEAAGWADGAKNAALLAAEDVATTHPVRLLIEDDQLDPKKTVTAFHKLIAEQKADAIITWSSQTTKAIALLAESRKIPLVAIASDPQIPKGRKYVFNLWVTPDEETAVLLPELKRRNIRSVMLVTNLSDATLAFRDSFKQHKEADTGIILDLEISSEEKNFTSYITKIRNAPAADAIGILLNPEQIGIFARQAREQGVTSSFFGYEMFEDASVLSLAQGALEGAFYATSKGDSEQFLKKFKERFPQSNTVTAAQTYDAVILLARAPQATSLETIQYLHELQNFTGASGGFSATGDNRFRLPAKVKEVRQGKFVDLKAQP